MRRTLLLALTALTLLGGIAVADRDGRRGGRDRDRGRSWSSQRHNNVKVNRHNNVRVNRNNVRVNRTNNVRVNRTNNVRVNRTNNVRVNRTNNVRVNRFRDYDRSRYRVVRAQRARPVFRNNQWHFAGGFSRPYVRPVFNVRYTNYYARPQPVYETYQTVPGYLWIAGSWQWNGYEWTWAAGRYEIDTGYQDNYYDGSVYYDYGF